MVRLRDRDTAAWQRGEIDDATFEKRQVRRAWKVTALLFAVLAVGTSVAGLVNHVPWRQSLPLVGILAVFGLVAAERIGGWARFAARNEVIKRRRQRVEDDPAMKLAMVSAAPIELGRFFGPHQRSLHYANWVLKMVALLVALSAALWWGYGLSEAVLLLGCIAFGLFCWGMFVRLDRRPYLDISSAGIWCRRWGRERVGFGELKAVYPRRNGANLGVTLVPRRPAELRPKLSWFGRHRSRARPVTELLRPQL